MKLPHPDPMLHYLQQLVVDMALIDRNHYLAKTDRRENDIEHSFGVALLCWYILARHKLKLDQAKVLKYALAHDFVEVHAGDTNTFASAAERQDKIKREAESLKKLQVEFAQFPELLRTLHDYEAKKDAEALFVWTVDKMQMLVMGDMDDWRPYQEINVDYERFMAKNAELLGQASSYIEEIFDSLIRYSQSTYYDQGEDGSKVEPRL